MLTPSETTKLNIKAAPFVKWAGGKRSIIGELVSRLPESFNAYWEPFAGGAALFFKVTEAIHKAHLMDINFDLIVTYNVIKRDPESLISQLEKHTKQHTSDYYYKIRAQHKLQNPVAIAARLLYLNKTCFNGLYRVNSHGEFNVPIGDYKNPDIVTKQNIHACSKALATATIECRQFDTILPQPEDFVYFDPPYHATIDTSFTNYTKLDFTEQDQIRLRNFVLALNKRNVKIMLSNSDTPFIRDLYKAKAFNITTIQAPRMINCKATKRGAVNEVLITNY